MARKRRTSMRWQLAAAFAGIALLTAVLLAAGLLAMLTDYYARAEKTYLQAAAARVLDEPVPPLSGAALRTWTIRAAIAAQSRVRVYGAEQKPIFDSGSPTRLDPSMLFTPAGVDATQAPPSPEALSRPPQALGGGLFGDSDSAAISTAQLRVALPESAGISEGYLVLSEPPSSGRGVIRGVAEGSLIAGFLAVALAAMIGYYLAVRMSRPIIELKAASDQMAQGDLSVRADVASTNEVGDLGESFNFMAERTEVTVTALRRFVADAAHEIGTPLTALQTDLQLAERIATTPDERRLVERAFAQAERLRDLAGGLLRLSRIEAGDIYRVDESSDLVARVRIALDATASRAEQADITVGADLPANAVLVAADDSRVDAVVLNLLENAMKFTPSRGNVNVSVGVDRMQAVLTVCDTGRGIPADEQETVFARFHRGSNAAGTPGSGLGLAIVSAAVESMNGTIALSSGAGETRFEVRLPLSHA